MNQAHHHPRSLQGDRELSLSVEVFPPASVDARDRLIAGLALAAPAYVSVTYGAGGTTRDRTVDVVRRLMCETPLEVAAHLTCVSASRRDVDDMVRRYREDGIRRIVALRGDPPGGLEVAYVAHPRGYQRTADLVAGILGIGDFDVSVAAYPEKHPQSPDLAADIDTLEAKVDAGARRAITQFFFENQTYFAFFERVRRRAIEVPIVPGILPVVNLERVMSFAARCGASVPAWLVRRFEGLDGDEEARTRVGVEIAAAQIAELAEAGVGAFHIYCLNRPELVSAIRDRLAGASPAVAAA